MKFDLIDSEEHLRRFLYVLISISLCFTGIKIIYAIIVGLNLNHVAGAWITIAMDLSDGIFYRPLFSESIGFGGTRFFPLFPSLHALFIELIDLPIVAGHVVSILSGILLFMGCYMLFRQMKLEPIIIAGLLAMLLCSSSVQLGLSTIRADILPVALNVCGIACFFSKYPARYKILFSALLFVLAFSAKITALNGFVTLLIWLLLNKKNKEAFMLLLFTALGIIIVLGMLYFGTSGRIVSIFNMCSSGGADFHTMLTAPIVFIKTIAGSNFTSLILLIWSFILAIKYRKFLASNIFIIYWLITIMITIFIFGSPGTSYNHLVDISTASILVLGAKESLSKTEIKLSLFRVYSIIIILFIIYNLLLTGPILANQNNKPTTRYPEEIIDLIKQDDSIVIAENPMLPIMANERPYMLDSFMLRLMIQKDTRIRQLTFDSIAEKKYSAIIFDRDPLTNKEWYSKSHFGIKFVNSVVEHYRPRIKRGNYVVYIPKQ